MTEPTNYKDFVTRAARNMKYEGTGSDLTMVSACPFCGAAEFLRANILSVEETLSQGSTCKECERSAKIEVRLDDQGGKHIEIVQTGGPEQPEWLIPKMRRIDQ